MLSIPFPPYWKLYSICSFVAIGGFLYGYDNGTISACLIMSDFQATFFLDDPAKSAAIVSVPMAASCVAAVLSGPIADTIGRKRSFLVGAGLHLLGTVLQLTGRQYATLMIGRIITGTSVGIFSFLVPLYQSEIARSEHRGRLITLYQFGVTLGFCMAFWIGYATFELPRHLSWQIPLGVQIGPAALMLLGLRWCIPESPRWLIYRGRKEEADVILSGLRMKGYQQQQQQQQRQRTGTSSTTMSSLSTHQPIMNGMKPNPIILPALVIKNNPSGDMDSLTSNSFYDIPDTLEMEYLGILQDVTFERQCASKSYSALLTKGTDNYRKRILLGMGLHIMTQFTGINALLFYLPHVLESMGLTQISSVLFGNGVSGVVNMVATIPVFFYIDRWDRRLILMTGAISMALCMAVIATILGINNDHTEPSSRPLYPGSTLEVSVYLVNDMATLCILVGLCLFLICFALSWGAMAWIYPAEIFSQLIRAKAMGVTTGSMFAFSILISQVAPLLFRYLGWRTYALFACLCTLMVFIVRGFYPETKVSKKKEVKHANDSLDFF
ncbi:major facilitator superfamily domain-containing protein [Chlamydoabsidia padenii]|nr:major facilitator superfamily domain-containing protein [Chlamydoabsidia padenii]